MSHPSRPQARSLAQRRRRELKIENPVPLEVRCMPAPYVAAGALAATFTAAGTPTNADLGTFTVASSLATGGTVSTAAPITSVSELTPISSFGSDIVTIAAGPGGAFGNDVYAISRGAGDNASIGAINQPGVIYRVDPATGKSSVFFNLNTVLSQTDSNNATPANPASNGYNSDGTPSETSGLTNWYSITFDPNGTFGGTPSMFVSSSDRSDPSKNIIFQIAPNGTLMGVFVQLTDGQSALHFTISPTAILVLPQQDQSFLSGMIAGSGISENGGTYSALYFNSSSYSPGQVISNGNNLPSGVTETELGVPVVADSLVQGSTTATLISAEGVDTSPIIGLAAANTDYTDPVYSIFTDFGTPNGGGINAEAGFSGIQGSSGDLLIGQFATSTASASTTSVDQYPAEPTTIRRFESIAFDQYGYFSQNVTLSTTTSTTGGVASNTYKVTTTSTGTSSNANSAGGTINSGGGSLFVSDLATGLYITVTPVTPLPTTPIVIPVSDFSGIVGATLDAAGDVVGTIDGSDAIGGRIIRVLQNGTVNTYAEGFATDDATDYTSFINSMLSISFSADGTVLYASDDDGIWQFKTTADLADSTSGQLVGLGDLQALGVPYDGLGSAVAVVDTGVDAQVPSFRGRVAGGTDIFTGGLGNVDTTGVATTSSSSSSGGTGGTTGSTSATSNGVISNLINGHGTEVAGVIAQFVPQATIVPVDIFVPFNGGSSYTSGSSSSGSSGSGTTGSSSSSSSSGVAATSNATSTSDLLYNGLQWTVTHPYTADPIRPGKVDRIIAASFAFGTTSTFDSELSAYKQYPQIVIALKNEYRKFLKEGIAPIASSGELGAPLGAQAPGSGSSGGTSGSSSGSSSSSGNIINEQDNNAANSALGDNEGMSLPAIIDQVISVSGVYSFPYTLTPQSTPVDQISNVQSQNGIDLPGPVLFWGSNLYVGGTASASTSGSSSGTTATSSSAAGVGTNVSLLSAGDYLIYANEISASVNRSNTTDFTAPAFNVPTFRRLFNPSSLSGSSTTGGTSTGSSGLGTSTDHLTFSQAGTSLSAAIVTGSYALVGSALNYWITLAKSTGYTADAYLNTPVGTTSLNYGKHALKNLTAWDNPNGINGILAWTAAPSTDADNGATLSTPSTLAGSTQYKSYATVNVANAVAAVEGYVAINYLEKHHDFQIIDSNHDGVVTAQELTSFVDNANSMGLPEAGSMAALLGGTDTTGAVQGGLNNEIFNENPDAPGVEQRRFNFFDYAADGQLNGSITLNELKLLSKTLLPSPDAYDVVDRQRASVNGFLLAPSSQRNFVSLQHILPKAEWVPTSAVKKYKNVTPAQFGVGQGQTPGSYLPLYTLFSPAVPSGSSGSTTTSSQVISLTKSAYTSGAAIKIDWFKTVTTTTPNSSSSSGTTTSPTATPTPTSTTSPTPTPTTTTTTTTTTTSSSPSDAVAAAITSLVNEVTGTSTSSSGTGTTSSSSLSSLTPSALGIGTLGTLSPAGTLVSQSSTGTSSTSSGTTGTKSGS